MTEKTTPEPVAYFAKRQYGGVDLWEQVHAKYAHMSDVVPLYAHPPAITNICDTIRNAGILTRNDVARLLNAIASNVVTNWPRTPRGSTTSETSDVCEWLDNSADQIEEGVGLSDWVRK